MTIFVRGVLRSVSIMVLSFDRNRAIQFKPEEGFKSVVKQKSKLRLTIQGTNQILKQVDVVDGMRRKRVGANDILL